MGSTNKKYSNISEILTFLNKTYCGPIGYEYMHISNPEERKWLRDRLELKTDEMKLNLQKMEKKQF